MEIRIDRLESIRRSQPDLVYFEAVVRFDDGTVVVSNIHAHYQEAVSAVGWILDYAQKNPGIYRLDKNVDKKELEDLWAIPPEATQSTYLDEKLFSVDDHVTQSSFV